MGRRRTKDLDLPPKMYRRGLSFYYVSAGKWYPLGANKAKALRLWAELEAMPTEVTVAQLVRQWLAEEGLEKRPNTQRQYASFARAIEGKYGDMAIGTLTVHDLYRWQPEVPRVSFNGCISLLRVAYKKAIKLGWCASNPAKDCEFNATEARGRYITDDEFRAIREKAPEWLQVAMDLSYLTGMRESDVLALRWDAITDGLYVTQIKTGTRQKFELAPALRDVLARARNRRVVGLYVVATGKGRRITGQRLREHFAAARTAAKVADVVFHDIRGKSATDAAEDGLDYQALLGHTNRKMSDRYVKAKRIIKAPTLRRNIG